MNVSDFIHRLKCKEIIKRVEGKNRTARFVCCITLLNYKNEIYQFDGVVEGSIAYESRGTNGFGYDPIFYYPPYGKTFAEVSAEEKNLVSHRAVALRAMYEKLKEAGYADK